jgi:hypothetical protein
MEGGGSTWHSDRFTGRTAPESFLDRPTPSIPARLVICFFLEFFSFSPGAHATGAGYLFLATFRDGWAVGRRALCTRFLCGSTLRNYITRLSLAVEPKKKERCERPSFLAFPTPIADPPPLDLSRSLRASCALDSSTYSSVE